MHKLVRTVFARLHVLDPVAEEAKLSNVDDATAEGEIKMSVSKGGLPGLADTAETAPVVEDAQSPHVEPAQVQSTPAVPPDRPQCKARVKSDAIR